MKTKMNLQSLKTELIKYNQMKQICDQHHIEVVFPNINELYTKYLLPQ